MVLPLTEQVNPDTTDIDRCSTLAILEKINREDRLVAKAAEKCLEALAPAVEAARKLKILLWDRGYLEEMMEETSWTSTSL